MKQILKKLKSLAQNLIVSSIILGLVFSSPILMDEMKDIYWVEYASKKAQPAKWGSRVVASTSQIEFRGNRYTLTNHHVCRIAERAIMHRKTIVTDDDLIGVEMEIGDKVQKILKLDSEHDLCILTPDLSKNAFKLASFYKVGERVTLIGHPRGLPQTIREGRIVASSYMSIPWVPSAPRTEWIMISTTTYPGNSGSPVLNRFGNLVGVLFAGQRGIHTEGYMVPVSAVKDFLERYERSLTK